MHFLKLSLRLNARLMRFQRYPYVCKQSVCKPVSHILYIVAFQYDSSDIVYLEIQGNVIISTPSLCVVYTFSSGCLALPNGRNEYLAVTVGKQMPTY